MYVHPSSYIRLVSFSYESLVLRKLSKMQFTVSLVRCTSNLYQYFGQETCTSCKSDFCEQLCVHVAI